MLIWLPRPALCVAKHRRWLSLFLWCGFSQAVWVVVAQWCNLPPIFAFNINDLLDLNVYANGSFKYKKGLQVACLTTFWCLWKARNVVFVQVPCSV
ncbi:hypothetical protein HanIR_Chr16g0813721 [Helianthus annuus]|nr:hypothetical protein HanIR_Chr16g0813721 [Helianthus annuus]